MIASTTSSEGIIINFYEALLEKCTADDKIIENGVDFNGTTEELFNQAFRNIQERHSFDNTFLIDLSKLKNYIVENELIKKITEIFAKAKKLMTLDTSSTQYRMTLLNIKSSCAALSSKIELRHESSIDNTPVIQFQLKSEEQYKLFNC